MNVDIGRDPLAFDPKQMRAAFDAGRALANEPDPWSSAPPNAGDIPPWAMDAIKAIGLGGLLSGIISLGNEFIKAVWRFFTQKFSHLALGITVYQQHPLPQRGKSVGQIHSSGCFADAALGHCHSNFSHINISSLILEFFRSYIIEVHYKVQ